MMDWGTIDYLMILGGLALILAPIIWRFVGRRRTETRLREETRQCHGQMYPLTKRGVWWCSQCQATTPINKEEWGLIGPTNGDPSSAPRRSPGDVSGPSP